MRVKSLWERHKGKVCFALIILLLFIGIVFLYFNQRSISEEVIRNYMSESLGQLNEVEVKMLSQNLSDEIDEKLQGMDTRELSENDLKELLEAVNKELTHATYNISPEKINEISNEILKKVIPDQEYQAMIDDLSGDVKQLSEASYSEEDIRRVAAELDLTEEDVIDIMKKAGITDDTLQKLAAEMNISVKELTEMIADNREYTDALYLELSAVLDLEPAELKQIMENAQNSYARYTYLSEKLGVTEEKLCAEIAKCKALSNTEIQAIAEQLNMTSTEFQTKLESNLQITDKQLQQLSGQVEVDLSKLESLIGKNKAETDETIQNLESKVDKSKEELQSSIDEVTTNMETKADTEVVTDIENRVGSLEDDISGKAEIHYSNSDGNPTLEISAVVKE